MELYAGFCFTIGAFLVAYYAWYLSWPVVAGDVECVESGVTHGSCVRGPRRYRIIRYRYPHKGKSVQGSRQGLILAGAMGPRVSGGETLPVSVCTLLPALSCPRRPLFEGAVLLATLAMLWGGAAVVLFLGNIEP